jgi:hypothetical protein
LCNHGGLGLREGLSLRFGKRGIFLRPFDQIGGFGLTENAFLHEAVDQVQRHVLGRCGENGLRRGGIRIWQHGRCCGGIDRDGSRTAG